jgi:hypothetical protein
MKRRTLAFAPLLLLPIALLAGCNAALGPGYTVKKQRLDARWTGTPELAVRGSYRLQNTGKGPLDFIEVTLPPESRRSGLQVMVDRLPVATQPADKLAPEGTVRIPINPPLPLKKKRDLVIEYRLAGSVGDVTTTPSFYLETSGWYPALREREGLFGSGGAPPEKWDLRVTAPRDFLVHASGQPKGRKRRDDLVEHRFRQRRGQDFDPFVVAGRYHERPHKTKDLAVKLWLYCPPDAGHAERIAQRIAGIVGIYERIFGPRGENPPPVYFVDTPAPLPESRLQYLRAIPNVMLSAGRSEPENLESISNLMLMGLSYTWFGHLVHAAPDEEFLLTDAIAFYAGIKAAEVLDSEARAEEIQRMIQRYGKLPDSSKQMNLLTLRSADVNDLNSFGSAMFKGVLFYFALEDRFTEKVLSAAFSRILLAFRGRMWNINDLRVAIHLETGEDPADFFRQWLNQPGIPEEFRKRYEKQVPGSR